MTQLSELCTTIVDSEHKTAPKTDDAVGYPLVRTTDIGRGRLDVTNAHRVDAEVYTAWTRRAVPQPGDLILAREAPVGNVALITPGMEPVLGQRTVLIRPDEEQVDPQFLTYRLLAHDIQHWMRGVANGATVPHLNMEDIRALPLLELPPLHIQNKIGVTLSGFDDLIENNRRRIEILEEMARLLYREWFVHFRFPGHEDVELVDSDLGPIPEGWGHTCLAEACSLVMGQSPKSEYYNDIGEGLPFHQGVSDFGKQFPTHTKWTTVDNRVAEAGDILFSVRAPVGRINVAPDRLVVGRGLSAIRALDGNQNFLLAQLKEEFAVEDSIGGGTIFNAVTKKDMESIVLLRPTSLVAEEFEAVVTPLADLVANLSQQNIALREARDLLLPRLVSGELDVSELDFGLERKGA